MRTTSPSSCSSTQSRCSPPSSTDGTPATMGSSSQRSDPPMTEKIRVLVADDHALFRRALTSVFDDEADIELVGEANDGEEAIRMAAELAPDVILMDVRMPKVLGIDAARQIKVDQPSTRIVMLTNSDEEEDLFEAIKAG